MTVAAALFLITASVTVLLWAAVPLYSLAARALKIPEKTGFPLELCVRNVRAIVHYLCLWGPKVLELPDFQMSASGTLHFRDVRDILLVIQVMAVLGLPIFLLGVSEGRKLRELGFLKAAVILMTCLSLVVLAGVLTDRTRTFILFHQLFFRNSYWQFDPVKDPVIAILTEEVFLLAAAFILLLLLLGFAWYLRLRKHGEKKRINNGKALLSHGKKRDGKGHH